jgi:hypothetical protein
VQIACSNGTVNPRSVAHGRPATTVRRWLALRNRVRPAFPAHRISAPATGAAPASYRFVAPTGTNGCARGPSITGPEVWIAGLRARCLRGLTGVRSSRRI